MVSRRRVLKYASKFFIPLKKTDLLNLNSGFAKLPQQSSRNPYCLWLTYEHPPHSLAHGGRMNMFSWLKSSHKLFQSKIGTEIKMFTSFPGKKHSALFLMHGMVLTSFFLQCHVSTSSLSTSSRSFFVA